MRYRERIIRTPVEEPDTPAKKIIAGDEYTLNGFTGKKVIAVRESEIPGYWQIRFKNNHSDFSHQSQLFSEREIQEEKDRREQLFQVSQERANSLRSRVEALGLGKFLHVDNPSRSYFSRVHVSLSGTAIEDRSEQFLSALEALADHSELRGD